MIKTYNLPYPLNLPEREQTAAFKAMSGSERLAIACELTRRHKQRWLAALHREFPTATESQFRSIVINRILEESAEERRIAAAVSARHAKRNEAMRAADA